MTRSAEMNLGFASRERKVGVGVAVVIAAILVIGTPFNAEGHNANSGIVEYVGPNCTWWGLEEFYDGKGTGISSIQSGPCDMAHVRVRYSPDWSTCTTAQDWGSPAIKKDVPTPPNVAIHLDWVDANVRLNGTWYGFRIHHAGSCWA